MTINKIYIKIFFDLYKSDKGLFAYTLYSRYGLKPSKAIEFLNEYTQKEVITVNSEQRIKLTAKGRDFVTGLSPNYNKSNVASFLNSIFSREKIAVYEPYIPNKELYLNEEESDGETSK